MKAVAIIALLGGIAAGVQAQPMTPDVQFSLRYFNQEIYTNDPDQAILLQVGLRNQGTSPVWFSLPSQPVFQLSFTVLPAGKTALELPPSSPFLENRFNNQPVFFRDISILPGEEFDYTINLRDFVDVSQSGVYTIQADFYPSLLPEFQSARREQASTRPMTDESPEDKLTSNILTLTVRPALPSGTNKVLQDNLDQSNQDYLKRQNLAPDEVVTYLLMARQNQERAKFFLYLNTEALYRRAPQFRRSFLNSGEEERQRVLAAFEDDLWNRDSTIAKTPSSFEILSTTYTPRIATVTAKLAFDAGDYLEYREYKYALEKNAGYWEIDDYQVRNLGTQRKGGPQ